ncbi:hypothetical protein PENSPDRAFT_546599, partial [Peniophora sp. CONT]
KPTAPKQYEGKPIYRLLETFVFDSRTFFSRAGIPRRMQMLIIRDFLSGRALDFYMREVSRHPETWMFKRFIQELFNYCFPENFRTVQRERFQSYAQRQHEIHEYRRELERLADSVGQISARDIVICFWQGADKWIR